MRWNNYSRVINLVLVCHDDLLLISSGEEEDRNQPDNDVKKDGKCWEREEINAEEFGADIDIPLVMQEGEYTGVMVYDTEDVYSMPTHSPRKKSEENTYYNLDPSPAPSPSTHKKKSVSSSLKSVVQFKLKLI